MQHIGRRKKGEYQTLLAIVQNPHADDPSQLWEAFKDPEEPENQLELDKKGFEFLKQKMSDNPRMIVK